MSSKKRPRTHTSSSQQSTSRDNYDPYAAFTSRRKLWLALEDAQKLEHETLNEISATVNQFKEKLLKYLSDWLLSDDVAKDQTEVQQITGISMSEWTDLQQKERNLRSLWDKQDMAVSRASSSLKQIRPIPVVSKLFATENEKAEITSKEKELEELKAIANQTIQQITLNDWKRREFGRRFLRTCLEHVPELECSRAFGIEITRLSTEVANSIKLKWQAYEAVTRRHLADMNVTINDLYRIYGLRG
jgi:hypothetical protein